jgi:hypothetical protein
MNKQSIKLLSLLSEAQPDDRDLAIESKVGIVLQSASYEELKHRMEFQEEFQKLFTESKLRSYNNQQLDAVIETMPIIPNCLENIMYSLKNGDCSKLTSNDRPFFLNKNSIEGLSRRLKDCTGKNYCNIEPKNFMTIFDNSTVKSIREYFTALPCNCEDYEKSIARTLVGRNYCISAQEVWNYEDKYRQQVAPVMKHIQEEKIVQFKYRVVKAFVGVLLLLVPLLYGRYTGDISSSMTGYCTATMLVMNVIYWLKG